MTQKGSSEKQKKPLTYDDLGEWVGPYDIAAYLSVPYSTAYTIVKRSPHRKFGKHCRMLKRLLNADPSQFVE